MKSFYQSVLVLVFAFSVGCSKKNDSSPAKTSTSLAEETQLDLTIPPQPNHMKYESAVPSEQSRALDEAISLIYRLKLSPQSYEVSKMAGLMGLTNPTPKAMQSWLEERVSYIVGADFDFGDFRFNPAGVSYPYPGELPDALGAKSQTAQVMMANMGAALYVFAKRSSKIAEGYLSGIGLIEMKSPRTGLLMIGPGLFQSYSRSKVQNVMVDIDRLSTLFHEARHSDGHGRSLGFLHAKCPSWHDYAGLSACDASTNGPYTLDAMINRSYTLACGNECSEKSKSILRSMYFDVASRTLYASDLPNTSEGVKAGTEWDATPEALP